MATFTSSADLNIRLPGGFEAIGAAGTTHRIPDSLATEFERDHAPHIPGFAWVEQDESTSAGGLGDVVVGGAAAANRIIVADSSVSATWQAQSALDHGSIGGLADFDHDQYVRGTHGGREKVQTIASGGASQALDIANANVFDITLDSATCTLTISGATSGSQCSVDIVLTQDSAGGRLVAWPAAFAFPYSQAPILSTVASAVDVVSAFTLDGGTTWRAYHVTGIPKTNYTATAAPASGDDALDGYRVGSFWHDVTNDKTYVCLDATVSSAVWTEITQQANGNLAGTEIDYAEITAAVVISATAESTAQVIISGASATYDGATIVRVEVFTPYVQLATDSSSLSLYLFQDSTLLGRIVYRQGRSNSYLPVTAVRRFAPSAGSHALSLRGWSSDGQAALAAGNGGSLSQLPAFLQVTRVSA